MNGRAVRLLRALGERVRRMTPTGVTALALSVIVLFVACRYEVAADRDITRFVVAGTLYTDPADRPPIHVFDAVGYDGQFYWRLAVDPTEVGIETVHGVRLDQPMRSSRIAYPALAWAGGLGQKSNMVWSLVLVNVVALALAARLAAALARRSGHPPIVGLTVVGASGLVLSLSRDLTEVVMVAAVLGGIVAIRSGRYGLAGVSWAVAALTHEQSLPVVAGYGLWVLVDAVRRRAWPGRRVAPVLVPLAAFLGWQLVARAQTGVAPLSDSGSRTLSVPFFELARAVNRWVTGGPWKQEALVLPQLALVLLLVVAAVRRRDALRTEDRWLLPVFGVTAVAAASLSDQIWFGPTDLRQIVLVPVLASVVIVVATRAPGRLTTAGVTLIWVATAVSRVLAI